MCIAAAFTMLASITAINLRVARGLTNASIAGSSREFRFLKASAMCSNSSAFISLQEIFPSEIFILCQIRFLFNETEGLGVSKIKMLFNPDLIGNK